jgi:putative tricarboxylic transport membrane protein
MEFLQYALEVLTLENLLWMTIGSLVGALLGALPGMSADTGLALFLPITFNLEPLTALITLGAIYISGSYGGNITAVLMNTPGTPDSLFMVFDGYPMTLRGEGARAIGITTISAFVGGLVGALALLLIAPPLALIAIKFGPLEMFLATMMGITIIIGLTKGAMLKGSLSACLGLLCALIGIDSFTSMPRFTFGIVQIYEELPLLPTVLGLFAVSQVLLLVAENRETIVLDKSSMRGSTFISFKDLMKMMVNMLRSSVIGTIVGIIPAAGTTVAAGISYNLAKRTDPNPDSFGHGNEQGLASVSAANNAVVGGSLVPLLTLSIPGNATSAIFLGGLLIHGLSPGTQLFTVHAKTIYGMLFGMIIAQLYILIIGLFGGPLFVKVTGVPNSVLIPLIGCFSILGAYSFRYLIFDMFLVMFFGVVGYYMTKVNMPLAPFVLAFVLGGNAELQLRRAFKLLRTNFWAVALKPLPLILLAICLLFLIMPFWGDIKKFITKKKSVTIQ